MMSATLFLVFVGYIIQMLQIIWKKKKKTFGMKEVMKCLKIIETEYQKNKEMKINNL